MRESFSQIQLWLAHVIKSFCRMVVWGITIAGFMILLGNAILKFFTSTEFTVENISISGNHRVSMDEIRALTAIAPGMNIWLLDLDDIQHRVEQHPLIRSARVQKVPPRRIYIEIQERNELAFSLREDGTLLGIGPEGVILSPLPGVDPNKSAPSIEDAVIQQVLSHPLLRGDLSLPATPGETITDPRAKAVLAFLAQLQSEAPDFFTEIAESELQKNGNLVLHIRRRIGMMILRDLHAPGLGKKIHAFWKVLEKEGLRVLYVDGRFPDQGFAIRADSNQDALWEQMHRRDNTI